MYARMRIRERVRERVAFRKDCAFLVHRYTAINSGSVLREMRGEEFWGRGCGYQDHGFWKFTAGCGCQRAALASGELAAGAERAASGGDAARVMHSRNLGVRIMAVDKVRDRLYRSRKPSRFGGASRPPLPLVSREFSSEGVGGKSTGWRQRGGGFLRWNPNSEKKF